ncbi:MAG TPA: VWA domain-containing protein [Acidobacteriota bacterium]|jgi:VWFA-related protein|nr:hypothetical protein [Acidobacteriota bacterium]HJO30889.1 VWA domain-containing protein [Acidobacteriota bacterium]|tara:strand:- start:995 stop:2359 length:1365 start_codon:yes stop_codon:yes gene_type:complete
MRSFSLPGMTRSSLFAIFGLLLIQGITVVVPAQSQQDQQAGPNPPVQFGASVETVLVDLMVADAGGNFVHGLTAEEFRVFEEGKEMEITFFAVEKFAAEDMVVGNPEIDAAPSLNRYIVIYVDGINTTPQDWLRVRPHLREWVEDELQPNDYVLLASLHPDGRMRMTPEFTRDSGIVVDALMKVEGNRDLSFRIARQERELAQAMGLESFSGVGDEIADAARLRQGAQLSRIFANQRRDEVRFGLDYLLGLADHLGLTFQVSGPKIVIMVSGGLPEIPGLNFRLMVDEEASDASPQIRQLAGLSSFQPLIPERSSDEVAQFDLLHAIGRFNRDNYIFYTIDARALGGGSSGDTRYGFQPNLSSMSQGVVNSNEQQGLLRIAGATGGLAFYNTSNFKAAFARVQQDTAFRYVLGYSLPTHDPKDIAERKFYRVKVEATVPGLKIRAREGYVDAGS